MATLVDAKVDLSPSHLNEDAAEPLYMQILDLFRERIVNGEIGPGQRLPAEHELTGMLGVSRITVKRALNELAASGLVRRQRGLGTVVTFDPSAPTVKGSFDTLIDGLTSMGLTTRVKLISVETVEAQGDIALLLELSEGSPVRRIVRSRQLEGEPFSYLVTHIPNDVASAFTDEELGRDSLIALLTKAGHGPREADQTITAVSADGQVAPALGVPMGSPVLRIHRIMRNQDGRPVQDITASYRADRFQYHMTLSRQSTTQWSGDH